MPCDADFYPDLHPHIHIDGHSHINIHPRRDADTERLGYSVMHADVYLYGNTVINRYNYPGEYLNIYFDIHKYKDKHSVMHKYAGFYENRNSGIYPYKYTGHYIYVYLNTNIYGDREPHIHINRDMLAYGYGEFFKYPYKYGDQNVRKYFDTFDYFQSHKLHGAYFDKLGSARRDINFDRDKYSGKRADGYAAGHGNQHAGKYGNIHAYTDRNTIRVAAEHADKDTCKYIDKDKYRDYHTNQYIPAYCNRYAGKYRD